MGGEDDFILNLGEDNCPAFKKAISDNYNDFANKVQTNNKDFLTRLNTLSGLTLDVPNALSFCEYLQWADMHNVALSIETNQDDIKKCTEIKNSLYQYYID